MKVKKKAPNKSNKSIILGVAGLLIIVSGLSFLYILDQDDTPIYIDYEDVYPPKISELNKNSTEAIFTEEIISNDPNNYLVKKINIKDGSIHYFYNKTETFGSKDRTP